MLLRIVIVAVLACAEGGYDNRLPGVPFQLANQATLLKGTVQNDALQTVNRAHYSLPNAHNFLQQHNDGQGFLNGYQTDQGLGAVSNGHASFNGYQTGQNYGTVSNGQGSLSSFQTGQSYGPVRNGQGSLNGLQTSQNYGSVSNGQGPVNGYQTVQSYGTVSNVQGSLNGYQTSQSLGSVSNEQTSLNSYQTGQSHGTVSNVHGSLNGYQTGQTHESVSYEPSSLNSYQTVQNHGAVTSSFSHQQNEYSLNANSGSQFVQAGQDYNSALINSAPVQPVQSVVKKYIYFHVAPPDAEEKRATPAISNRRKTYNIVFIKVPSQQNRYAGSSQLLQNQYAVSETKTLIYVLVKKPENQVYKQTTPNHEVFYVKYKGNPDRAVSQLSSDVSQTNTLRSLQPGLINGQS